MLLLHLLLLLLAPALDLEKLLLLTVAPAAARENLFLTQARLASG
jgi:hypothetical protein